MRVKVSLQPGENPRNEYVGKRDFEGDVASIDEAKAAWKTLNGLDGIGVDFWPIVAEEVKKAAPAK